MGLIASNNVTGAPGVLIGGVPAVPADFAFAGSPAVDSGITVPVWSDFFVTSRPVGGTFDAGVGEF